MAGITLYNHINCLIQGTINIVYGVVGYKFSRPVLSQVSLKTDMLNKFLSCRVSQSWYYVDLLCNLQR